MSESAVEVREVVEKFGDNVVVTAVVVLMLIPIVIAARLTGRDTFRASSTRAPTN